jgi:hypothetical protein
MDECVGMLEFVEMKPTIRMQCAQCVLRVHPGKSRVVRHVMYNVMCSTVVFRD